MAYAWSVLTGNDWEWHDSSDYATDQALFDAIKAALDNGDQVVISTWDETKAGNAASDHGYVVDSVDVAGKRIRVYNPWGQYEWIPLDNLKNSAAGITVLK
ncbi:MAG: hypothetical protein HYS13_22435 [Planctomycetia bacterium]|nr:hypothetical protein [Planctomycetia bacterium]